MYTEKTWFDKIIFFIFVSSQDPRKASLTVKAALIAAIPFILKAIAFSCGLGYFCVVGLDQNALESIAAIIGNIIFWGTSLIAGFIALVAFVRKVLTTNAGENAAVQ